MEKILRNIENFLIVIVFENKGLYKTVGYKCMLYFTKHFKKRKKSTVQPSTQTQFMDTLVLPGATKFLYYLLRRIWGKLLPPANEVWGTVLLSQVFVCPWGVCIQGGLHPGASAPGVGSASRGVGQTPIRYYMIRILLECILVLFHSGKKLIQPRQMKNYT